MNTNLKEFFLHSQYVQGLPFIGIQCKSDNVECNIDFHHYQEKLVTSYVFEVFKLSRKLAF